MRPDAEEILRLVLARLDDMKAEDTLAIDLRDKSSVGDYMVVSSGRSQRHVGSVADRVVEDLHKAGVSARVVAGNLFWTPEAELLHAWEACGMHVE